MILTICIRTESKETDNSLFIIVKASKMKSSVPSVTKPYVMTSYKTVFAVVSPVQKHNLLKRVDRQNVIRKTEQKKRRKGGKGRKGSLTRYATLRSA